jgi:twitching motility protein PilT
MMDERQQATFENHREVDFAYSVSGVGRFRVNVFHQRGKRRHDASARRHRPCDSRPSWASRPSSPSLADEPRGLVLVTGTAGSGKTTTLAAMIDHINSTREGHIVTIEDPIEVLHSLTRSAS